MVTIKQPNRHDRCSITAIFKDLADSVIPVSRVDQDAILRKFLLHGSLIFVEECFSDASRMLAAIDWTTKSPPCIWSKINVSRDRGISNE